MRRWHLPALLMRITDDKHARDNKVRCVYLAVRLARHPAHGWDNAAPARRPARHRRAAQPQPGAHAQAIARVRLTQCRCQPPWRGAPQRPGTQ